MSFYKAPFWRRFEIMGDWSEAAVIAHCKNSEYKYAPFGFNRPDISMRKLPLLLRHTPDFIVEGFIKETQVFVEAKGLGRDNLIKIKQEDLEVLTDWDKILPIYFSLYHSTKQKISFGISLKQMESICGISPSDLFPDNKKLYYKVSVKNFQWEPIIITLDKEPNDGE